MCFSPGVKLKRAFLSAQTKRKLDSSSFPSRSSVQNGACMMHPLYAKADELSGQIIGAAVEVHRIMGPGLLESIYQRCLVRELELRGIPCLSQQEVVID